MRDMACRAKRKRWRELPKDEWWVEGYAVRYQPCVSKDEYIYGIASIYGGGLYITEIDQETLCSYTGMTDKSGNWIWENDIVSCEHEKFQDTDQWLSHGKIKYTRNYVVEFVNTGSNYGYRLRNKSIHFMLTGNVIYNHNVKVIGNVFDNADLLKGE